MKFVEKLNEHESAMTPRPATVEDIEWANKELKESGFPELPADYAAFLQQCNGFAFNGVEIFGTDIVTDRDSGYELIDIITFNEQQREYYNENLLFFGRVDDDVYTYNPQTQKYEARDICGFDIWDDYENINDFLDKEIATKYL